jgi:hypothetical protein
MSEHQQNEAAADAAEEAVIEAAIEAASAVDVAEATLLGDLIEVCIDELKASQDVWQKLSERGQQDALFRVRLRCEAAVRKAVRIIAAADRPTIFATLEQVTVKDGIKAVLKLDKHDAQRHELVDATGRQVLIVVASAEQHLGGEGPKPDADQPDLPIADAGQAASESPGTAAAD